MRRKKGPLIDTNVILRYLLEDLPEQSEASARFMENLGRGEEAYIHDVVIAEVIWTLEKFYKVPRSKIRDVVSELLSIRGIVLSNKGVLLRALQLYADKKIDFLDALLASLVLEDEVEVVTFDKDFRRVGVTIRNLLRERGEG